MGGLEGGDEGGLLLPGGFFGWEGTLTIDGEVAVGIDGGVVVDVEGHRSVGFAVDAGGKEFDESFTAEHLELLSDFGFDIVVVGMAGFQLVNKGVHLLQCEGGAELFGALEDIEQPAAAFDAPGLQGVDLVIFPADFIFIQHLSIADDGDFGRVRDFTQQDIAALPPGSCGGVFQLLSFLDDVRDEKAPGNDDEIVYLVAVVVQEEEAGVIERGDALNHGAVDAIDDAALESGGGGFFALQFILGAAVLADVVFDRGVGFGGLDGFGAADGAVHVAGEPVFGETPGNLGGAFVALYQGGVES